MTDERDVETSKENQARGKFIVKNDYGIHLKPAVEIVKCLTSFKSEVMLVYRNQKVNAKSLLSILILEAKKGANISIEAKGEDAEEAAISIINLANKKFYFNY